MRVLMDADARCEEVKAYAAAASLHGTDEAAADKFKELLSCDFVFLTQPKKGQQVLVFVVLKFAKVRCFRMFQVFAVFLMHS